MPTSMKAPALQAFDEWRHAIVEERNLTAAACMYSDHLRSTAFHGWMSEIADRKAMDAKARAVVARWRQVLLPL